MNVFLEGLIEAAADDKQLVPENRVSKVAALDVGHRSQMAPLRVGLGQQIRDLVRDAHGAEAADLDIDKIIFHI